MRGAARRGGGRKVRRARARVRHRRRAHAAQHAAFPATKRVTRLDAAAGQLVDVLLADLLLEQEHVRVLVFMHEEHALHAPGGAEHGEHASHAHAFTLRSTQRTCMGCARSRLAARAYVGAGAGTGGQAPSQALHLVLGLPDSAPRARPSARASGLDPRANRAPVRVLAHGRVHARTLARPLARTHAHTHTRTRTRTRARTRTRTRTCGQSGPRWWHPCRVAPPSARSCSSRADTPSPSAQKAPCRFEGQRSPHEHERLMADSLNKVLRRATNSHASQQHGACRPLCHPSRHASLPPALVPRRTDCCARRHNRGRRDPPARPCARTSRVAARPLTTPGERRCSKTTGRPCPRRSRRRRLRAGRCVSAPCRWWPWRLSRWRCWSWP